MNKYDSVLSTIVSTVNSTDLEIGVTLNVKGTVITGWLISTESYLTRVSKSFKDQGELEDVFSTTFKKWANDHNNDFNEKNDLNPKVLHLKKAKVISGHTIFDLDLWRGNIESVDGYTFGLLGID